MKLILLLIAIPIVFSCQEEIQEKKIQIQETKVEIEEDYSLEITYVKNFAKNKNYNKKIAFMIDYSIHSGRNRFFVIDLVGDSILKKGLVCHGDCKGKNNRDTPLVFSNKSGSNCTSLGMAVISKRDYSSWGKNYKYWLEGLEKTNKNMRKRVVVLHAWEGVPDKEIYPKTMVMSWGCPTVSVNFLDKLDVILKKNKKVLLYSFE